MSPDESVTPKSFLDRRGFLSRLMGVTASLLAPAAMKAPAQVAEAKGIADRTVDSIQSATFTLPPFQTSGERSFEEVLQRRRSQRKFSEKPMTIAHLSQLLWAGQGVTGEDFGVKFRTAPSAGALYPLDIYAVLPTGVYRYQPPATDSLASGGTGALIRTLEGDKRIELAIAALAQEFIAAASVDFVITAEYERSMVKYQQRGVRYSVIEVGNVSQNIYLQAEALGLATVAVGAFNDDEVQRVLKLPKRHRPLIIMPTGYALLL